MSVTSGQRRQLRRQATIDEIVGHAVDIMTTDGVAGLSLGEIARRMGVRTPSLYTYVSSKDALYDELFRRGWEATLAALNDVRVDLGPVTRETDPVSRAVTLAEVITRWGVTNHALGQLMFWRPVPQFTPSVEAYAPSLRVAQVAREEIRAWISAGCLDPLVDPDLLAEAIITVIAGVMTRKVVNEPGAPYEDGPIAPVLPYLITHIVSPYVRSRP
ncbi:TetR/AcrR family transcriptional regulator [Raineyella sp. LH-20]|uniref:TetR/AcrR family transcriptional regulator n=1 Tax=Raineyella sp. LH-20 TaxID=3081204 RepID=UPI00295369F2|nr:TetR/AcrR family transcriptional regulator [Raineyella sp. LH-20]WOP19969.1 TetR/AcrR family transcriptional regulator [Raineyella sp. LH-20]